MKENINTWGHLVYEQKASVDFEVIMIDECSVVLDQNDHL